MSAYFRLMCLDIHSNTLYHLQSSRSAESNSFTTVIHKNDHPHFSGYIIAEPRSVHNHDWFCQVGESGLQYNSWGHNIT